MSATTSQFDSCCPIQLDPQLGKTVGQLEVRVTHLEKGHEKLEGTMNRFNWLLISVLLGVCGTLVKLQFFPPAPVQIVSGSSIQAK